MNAETKTFDAIPINYSTNHPAPTKPDAELEHYNLALNAEHIHNIQLPMAEQYWRDPGTYRVPRKAPDGASTWGMEDVKRIYFESVRKIMREQVEPHTGRDPGVLKEYLMKVASKRLGVKSTGYMDCDAYDEVTEAWIEAVWQELDVRFQNPSMTYNVLQIGRILGEDSETAHGLFLTVPGGCCLEGAYGCGLNSAGIYRQIGPKDAMSIWVPNNGLTVGDLGYHFELMRSREFADAISQANTIVSLGAGWLPEVRHMALLYGKVPDLCGKTLYACDKDDKIPEELFGEHFADSGLRIIYEKQEISAALPGLIQTHAGTVDLVYAKGVVSFMHQKLGSLIGAALQLLRKGGKFKFDLQLNHDILKRDILLFSWGGALTEGKLHLMTNEEATEHVQKTIAELCTALDITLEWTCVSDKPEDPMGLIFTVTKC